MNHTCAVIVQGQARRPRHRSIGISAKPIRETWSLLLQEAGRGICATDESLPGRGRQTRSASVPGVAMHRSTALRLLHHHGEQARAFVADKLKAALSEADRRSATPDRRRTRGGIRRWHDPRSDPRTHAGRTRAGGRNYPGARSPQKTQDVPMGRSQGWPGSKAWRSQPHLFCTTHRRARRSLPRFTRDRLPARMGRTHGGTRHR